MYVSLNMNELACNTTDVPGIEWEAMRRVKRVDALINIRYLTWHLLDYFAKYIDVLDICSIAKSSFQTVYTLGRCLVTTVVRYQPLMQVSWYAPLMYNRGPACKVLILMVLILMK